MRWKEVDRLGQARGISTVSLHRVVTAKSAPPATNVAHPPKTKEARANHCSPEPLQLVLRIGSATSHQKETAKVRPNTTATAIPVDLSNAILQPHSTTSLDPWPIEDRKTMRQKSRLR